RRLPGLRRRSSSGVLLLDLLLSLHVVLVEILRHALLHAGHAVRENRFALARQLLLGVEPVEHVGRIEAAAESAGAAAERARERDQDRGCDQAVRTAHGRSPGHVGLSSWQPAAATPAAPGRASAGSAGYRRRPKSGPATAARQSCHWRGRPIA